MTNEEAIKFLKGYLDAMAYTEKCRTAHKMAIKALEQEPCDDCIIREQAIRATYGFERYTGIDEAPYEYAESILRDLPPVAPQPKIGHWILTQRDNYVDINCSECSNTRIKGYAYGYTVDELNLEEINDWIAKTQMNYCECCGAKMQGVKE